MLKTGKFHRLTFVSFDINKTCDDSSFRVKMKMLILFVLLLISTGNCQYGNSFQCLFRFIIIRFLRINVVYAYLFSSLFHSWTSDER